MKWIAVLVMLTVAFVALADESADYFPRAIGNEWVYEDSTIDGVDTTVSVVVGTATILGYETWILEDTDAGGTDSSYTQFRTDGIYVLVSLLDSLGTELHPMKMAPAVVNVGDSWVALDFDTSISQSGIDIALEIDVDMEALGRDDVTVPAGFFSNCMKLNVVSNFSYVASMGGVPIASGSGVQERDTMWAAINVGTVQERGMTYEIDYMSGGISDSSKTRNVLLDYDFTGVDEQTPLPGDFSLEAYPNPFNASVRIVIDSRSESAERLSTLEIFDVNGRSVAELTANGACRWMPNESLGSGVYLVRATMGGESVTKHIILLK